MCKPPSGGNHHGSCPHCDFHLHLQRVLGGVRDLGCDVGNLANEHGEQELGFLHPNQSCQAAVPSITTCTGQSDCTWVPEGTLANQLRGHCLRGGCLKSSGV
ncbi:hypothetical protein EYF80_013195 [Liparis tanakae]|uniref:Uncharacterized protein n=1 Tax=Liparis tanakae TaxID=230148 RepID=A0A4Z2IFY0_9TELE|nr:hypothetical protein EYF80_013195 [Liparis tanakae]